MKKGSKRKSNRAALKKIKIIESTTSKSHVLRPKKTYLAMVAAILVVALALANSLTPASAGIITVTFDSVILNSVGSTSGSVANTANGNNGTYYGIQDRRSGNNITMDVDFSKTNAISGQGTKMYRLDFVIDANASLADNYYVKMYSSLSGAFENFGDAFISNFSPAGTDQTITKTITDLAQVNNFFNNGSPRVKIQNAKSHNGGVDNGQSWLYIDSLEVKFYEDTTIPLVSGGLTPGSKDIIKGLQTLTLSGVTDSESGVKEVEFVYRKNGTSDPWVTIGIDTTPNAQNNFSVSWDTTLVADDSYEIAAFARDKVLTPNVTSSLSTNVQVQNTSDTIAPYNVSILNPSSGKRVNNPTVTANAEDNTGIVKVEFYYNSINPVLFATDSDPAGGWTAQWNTSTLNDGQTYDLWVVAYDSFNNSTASTPVFYIVDKTAPTVQGTDPPANTDNIPANRPPISATFDGPMDPGSFGAGTTFKVQKKATLELVPGQITGYDSGTYTVTFTPDNDLPVETWLRATLTTSIKDEAGNALASDYTWDFYTVDTSSPVISSIEPGEGTKLKIEHRLITATATDNVAVTKVEFFWQDVAALNGWNKFGSDTNIADGWTALLDTAVLPHDGYYDLKVLAYDARNNPPGEKIVRYSVDNTQPEVLPYSRQPALGATGISINTSIKVVFSEGVLPESVNSTNVYLTRDGSPEVISTNVAYDESAKTVTMTLPQGNSLDYKTKYMAWISQGVTDLYGNFLSSIFSWDFTTETDEEPPVLTVRGISPKTISPANLDGKNDSVTITFDLNEEADVGFTVYNENNEKAYQSTPENYLSGSSLTIVWDGKDNYGGYVKDGSYLLVLEAVDSAGNSAVRAVLERLAVDNQGPFITQAVAESRTKIKISFNEAMDPASATNKFFYSLSETYNSLAVLEIAQITSLDNKNFLIETTTQQRTDRTSYIITVNNLLDLVGNAIQNPSATSFVGFNPHGLYNSNTGLCSNCHLAHSAQGIRLVNSIAIKELCYNCHNGGGQSTHNNVKKEFSDQNIKSYHPVEKATNHGGMISCENCHNIHGDFITTGTLYPKLLRSKETSTGQMNYQGNGFCWGCHGSNSILPSPYGNKQSYYPSDGSVHNNPEWEDPDTKVRCAKCHLHHGSYNTKLAPPSVTFNGITTNLADVSNNVCATCHRNNPGKYNFDYNGWSIYSDAKKNPHYNRRCVDCHDAHSQKTGKLLKRTFVFNPEASEVSGDVYYNGDFTWDNYQTCIGCHTGTHTSMTKMTKKNKDYYAVTDSYKIPTTFWQESLWDPDSYNPKTNLHDYHLNLKNYKPGYGNATCKECHRFHGPLAEENPNGFGRITNGGNGKSRLVGFPMRGSKSVEAYTYAEPVWKMIDVEGQPAGGTCNLVCHGKVHEEVTYLAGNPPPPEVNKDASCYSCHQTSPSYDPLDIETLMGEGESGSGVGGKFSRHIVNNIDQDLTGGNGCLTECHKPHSASDTTFAANNTLFTIIDSGAKTSSEDWRLCQSCHKNSPTEGAAPITDLYPTTAHSYELSYHDYGMDDGSNYKGDCMKCHNPHGTDNYDLLSFTNRGLSFARDSSVITNFGKDNSVCLACHTPFRSITPNWPGNNVYTHPSNPHGARNITGTDLVDGYCMPCHDAHGKEDAKGLIPNFLLKRGNASCYDCHETSHASMPGWTGRAGYDAGAHNLYANDGNSKRVTGACEVCHAAHGNDDGTGAPVKELLHKKEEGSCFLPGASGIACHGVGGKSALNGNRNIDIKSLYDNKTYKHGNIYDSDKHVSTERTMPNSLRHAECEDCHNSHTAKAGTSIGTNTIKPSSINVWGITIADSSGNPVDPNNPVNWPVPAVGSLVSPSNWTVVENSQYEWQICYKCHSKWAYGSSPPPSTTWSGANALQTDTPAEFNPNNYGHHAVITRGKNQPGSLNPNFVNSFVAPWDNNSTLACSDCHASNNSKPNGSGEALGTHGSNFRYILVQNITGVGTLEVFCYNCHKREVYADIGYSATQPTYSRWSHPDNSNHAVASNNHVSGIWCLNCHMGDVLGGSHGSNSGPGPGAKSGYTSQPLGRRLMNGANMATYSTAPGNIACWTKTSTLSNCTKSHSGTTDSINYNY